MSNSPQIELRRVTKTYCAGEVDVEVLRGIDLRIESGEHVSLVGRSGSGKSTLLNILGCLDLPSSGSYRFGGENVSDLSDDELSHLRNRAFGFVFQSFHLLPGIDVQANVELPLEYAQVPRSERRRRAAELLERVGLAGRERRFPRQLSGGERQRVAIARALVGQPKVLLADEPTGNLDLQTHTQILELFSELHRDLGMTLLMVTHDSEIAARAPRRIRLADGRMVADA